MEISLRNLTFSIFTVLFIHSFTFSQSCYAQEGQSGLANQTYASGEKGDYLAGTHIKNGYASSCIDCHSNNAAIDDSETSINKSCQDCHGTYEDLRNQLRKGNEVISDHEGHLIEPACTTCHAGHTGSFSYCNYCHSFKDMKIPFAKAKVPYVPEDLSFYQNRVPNHVETTDILVIGSGGAGLMAAGIAANAGKKVIIVEKMPIIGGSSILSSGGMNAANTSLQQKVGISKDSPATMIEDTLAYGKTNDVGLVTILAEGSDKALEWFISKGAELTVNPKVKPGKTTFPRSHYTTTGGIGKYMIPILNKELTKNGITVRTNSKAVKLQTDEHGNVIGALIHGKHSGLYEVRAGATILATGSYAKNQKLIASSHPELAGIISTTQPGAHGDAIAMGESIGAKVINLENIQVHPNAAANTSIMVTQNMRIGGGHPC